MQGDENQATEGEGGGFEAGGAPGQSYGVIDDGDKFGAGGREVGERGAGEVTFGGWRGIGSAVGLEVGVVGGMGEGRFEFSEPGGPPRFFRTAD
ncbi:MAG: hypothetical protein ACRDSO_03950 [Pseudonocardiaceae bacterium]